MRARCAGRSTSIRSSCSSAVPARRSCGGAKAANHAALSGKLARSERKRKFHPLKQELEQLLLASLAKLVGSALPEMPPAAAVTVERTREARARRICQQRGVAPGEERAPRTRASSRARSSPRCRRTRWWRAAEVAGAGFINFHLAPEAYARELAAIHARGAAYGESTLGAGERVLVEFVSANPTGPLHVGHGRQAAYGATLANILAAVGYSVEREYYINDAGRQMDILAVSTWVRYLEACGESLPFPENGYRGDYVRPLAQRLRVAAGAAAAAARGHGARGPAGGCPGGRQGSLHRCPDRALPRAHRRRAASVRCWTCRSGRCSRTSAPTWPSSAWCSITGPPSAPSPTAARSITPWRCSRRRDGSSGKRGRAVVPCQRVRRREGPGGGARERPEDLLRLRHRLPPRQVRARLQAPDRRAWRGSPRLRRARARRAHRHGTAGGLSRSDPDPVREPVPRHREDPHGQARSAVRDAAAAAYGSRQRRLSLLLPDAQPRPAA